MTPMNTPNLVRTNAKACLMVTLAGLFLCSSALAQKDETGGDDGVYELSPFVVEKSADKGYQTTQTLLGSRLNSKLVDSPSAITVLTPEYLEDVGATSLYDALNYTTGANADETSVRFFNSWRTAAARVRGFQVNTDFTQDFFKIFWTPNTYNTTRMGLSRGPNAILFGVGNPAGVFTASSKRAQFNDFGELSLKLDTWGSTRVAIDYNAELVDEKVAARVALLSENREFFEDPAWDDMEGAYLALNAELVDSEGFKTNLIANYEYRDAARVLGAEWTPADAFTPWEKAGRPTFAGAAPGGDLSSDDLAGTGVRQSPWGDGGEKGGTVLITGHDGSARAYYRQYQLATYRSFLVPEAALKGDFTFRDESDSPVPFDVNLRGPGAEVPFNGDRYTLKLEQQVGANFFAELAYMKHDYDIWWGNPAVGLFVLADPHEDLPDGSPNPDVGKLFTMSPQRPEFFHRENQEIRFTASYDLKLAERSQWLGDHRLSFLYSDTEDSEWRDLFTEQNSTPLPGASSDISDQSNRILRRTYLSDLSPGQRYLSGPSMFQPISANGVDSILLARSAPELKRSEVESMVYALQSRFWDERIVLTIGWREDDLARFAGEGVQRDPATRDFPRASAVAFQSSPALERDLDSTSRGIVFHATDWLSLFYNDSENFNPEFSVPNLFGEDLPPQGGEGEDYGIRFRLLSDNLYINLNLFENSSVNIPAHRFFRTTDVPRLRGLLLLRDGTDSEITSIDNFADTQDESAEGHELEIIGNLTDNWRVSLSYSDIEIGVTNIAPILIPWWEENVASFQALGSDTVLPNTGETVQTAIDWWDGFLIQNLKAGEGRAPNAHREENLSLVTNYTFGDGPLGGFSVGGKVRWFGESAYVNGLVGRDYALYGLHFGYQTTLFEKAEWIDEVGWKLMLHIDNVTDFEGPIRGENHLGVWRPLPGASASLTSTFSF